MAMTVSMRPTRPGQRPLPGGMNMEEGYGPRRPAYGQGGVSVPNYYTGNYNSPNMMTGNYGAGNAMTGNYQAGNAMTGNYGAQNFLRGNYGAANHISGDYGARDFFKGFQNMKGGESYFRNMFMPKDGSFYFNEDTIDMVDKAGDTAGLEAEASRLLGRSGGVQAAMMSGSGGFNGGLADMQRSMLGSQVMGGLARDINTDRYNRESMIQQGTLARQQGIAGADLGKSQMDLSRRQGIMSGDQARAGMDLQYRGGRQQNAQFNAGQRLSADQARNQASQFNAGQRLNADLGRNASSQFNAGQRLSRDTTRQQTMNFNAGNRLAADQTRQGTMQFNAGQRLSRDQMAQQNAQFNVGTQVGIANSMTNAWMGGQQLWNDRLGIGAGMMQNPAMGYVDPRTGRPSAMGPPPGSNPGFFAPGGGPFGLW